MTSRPLLEGNRTQQDCVGTADRSRRTASPRRARRHPSTRHRGNHSQQHMSRAISDGQTPLLLLIRGSIFLDRMSRTASGLDSYRLDVPEANFGNMGRPLIRSIRIQHADGVKVLPAALVLELVVRPKRLLHRAPTRGAVIG